jgi:hypothetical protein
MPRHVHSGSTSRSQFQDLGAVFGGQFSNASTKTRAPLRHLIAPVVGIRSEPQVFDPTAAPIVACVEHLHPVRDGTMLQQPCVAMRSEMNGTTISPAAQCPVSIVGHASRPYEAFAFDLQLGGECRVDHPDKVTVFSW